MSVYAIIQV